MGNSGSPVFTREDRVDPPANGGGLPAELVGKTPAEIAQYYQNRETLLRAELTRPVAPPVPANPTPPPDVTNAEFFNNPTEAAKRIIASTGVSKEEWERIKASSGPSLIWAAKMQVKEKHSDFNRLETEINAIMDKCLEWQRTDPTMWETAYIYAKGANHDRLNSVDRASAAAAASGERVNPGGQPPVPDADLTKVTLPGLLPKHTAAHVADQLGVSHDLYRKSSKELEGEGKLPMTYDNRSRR